MHRERFHLPRYQRRKGQVTFHLSHERARIRTSAQLNPSNTCSATFTFNHPSLIPSYFPRQKTIHRQNETRVCRYFENPNNNQQQQTTCEQRDTTSIPDYIPVATFKSVLILSNLGTWLASRHSSQHPFRTSGDTKDFTEWLIRLLSGRWKRRGSAFKL